MKPNESSLDAVSRDIPDRWTLLHLLHLVASGRGKDSALDQKLAAAFGWSLHNSGLWIASDPLAPQCLDVPAFTADLNLCIISIPRMEAENTQVKNWPATVDIRRHDDGSASVSIRATDTTPDEAQDELFVEAEHDDICRALLAAILKCKIALIDSAHL